MEKVNEVKINKDIAKIKDSVKDIVDVDAIEDLIKNNEIEFEYKEIQYKVKKPTFKQKQETNEKRISKYTELLKDPNMLLENDLIDLYKKRGIDINEMNKQYDSIGKEMDSYMFRLGKAIKEKKPNKDLEIFKTELNKLHSQQQEINMKKAVLLDTSIQSQVNIYIYTYLAFLVLEKLEKGKDLGKGNKEQDKWVKAFDKYDTFINQAEPLVNTAVYYVSLISKNELPLL